MIVMSLRHKSLPIVVIDHHEPIVDIVDDDFGFILRIAAWFHLLCPKATLLFYGRPSLSWNNFHPKPVRVPVFQVWHSKRFLSIRSLFIVSFFWSWFNEKKRFLLISKSLFYLLKDCIHRGIFTCFIELYALTICHDDYFVLAIQNKETTKRFP